uniref:Integrase catalytic domain-containing protein n=1 Tax=Trichogramma kaykai TaxID=54128 RepID=A0ABD2X0E1_9HYME
MDMRALKSYNDDYGYLLAVIDILSKHAWIEPIKDKSGKSVATALSNILQRSNGRTPVVLQTDKGKEFIARKTLTALGKKNIQHRVV